MRAALCSPLSPISLLPPLSSLFENLDRAVARRRRLRRGCRQSLPLELKTMPPSCPPRHELPLPSRNRAKTPRNRAPHLGPPRGQPSRRGPRLRHRPSPASPRPGNMSGGTTAPPSTIPSSESSCGAPSGEVELDHLAAGRRRARTESSPSGQIGRASCRERVYVLV